MNRGYKGLKPQNAENIGLSTVFTTHFQSRILAVAAREPFFLELYMDVFNTGMFDTQYHKDLCSWILEYYQRYRTQPSRSTMLKILREKLPADNPLRNGYKVLISQIYEMDLSESEYIRDQVIVVAKYQSVKSALLRLTDMLDRGEFHSMLHILEEALRMGSGVGDLGLELVKAMETAVLKFGTLEQSIETGFKELEKAIGGIYAGEETIVVSPPGQGKTTLLGNLAHGAARHDHIVFYYTLEIRDERMLCRLYSNMAKVETKFLSNKIDRVRSSVKRFRVSSGGTIYVKFFPARGASVETIRSHLSLAKSYDIKPTMIVIDYADLLRSANNRAPRHEQLREIYEDIRALADEYNVHALSGSQSVRKSLYASIIDLDDLSESWGKAATADSIVAMCQGWEEQQAGVLRLFVAKARNETRGRIVRCKSNFKFLNIAEIDIKEYVRIMRDKGYSVTSKGELRGKGSGKRHARLIDEEIEDHYSA